MLRHPLNLKNKYFLSELSNIYSRMVNVVHQHIHPPTLWASHGEYPLFTAAIIIDKFREQQDMEAQ